MSNLGKRYGDTAVFSKVSIEVARGEFVAIVGESGVGKSTLLNCMAGLDSWDEGSVILDGHDLAALNDDQRALLRRRQIGFVFQAFHVLPHLDVAQNVALPLMLLGQPDDARVESMLRAVGLDGLGPRLPQQLSGGQLQRVAIARALVHRPATVAGRRADRQPRSAHGCQGDGRADLANPRARRFIGAGHAFRGGRDARRPGAASDQRGRDRQAIARFAEGLAQHGQAGGDVLYGHLPGRGALLADREGHGRSEGPTAQPRHRSEPAHGHADHRDVQFLAGLQRGAEQGEYVLHIAWHDGHLGHIRTQPLRFVEPLDQNFQRRRALEIVERQDELDAVVPRQLAHLAHLLWLVAHLVVDQVDVTARAHGAIQGDDLRFRKGDVFAALFRRAAGEQQRDSRGCLLDARGQIDDLGRIAYAFEEVHPPFQDVGLLGRDDQGLGQQLLARAAHEGSTDCGNAAAADGSSVEFDRFGLHQADCTKGCEISCA